MNRSRYALPLTAMALVVGSCVWMGVGGVAKAGDEAPVNAAKSKESAASRDQDQPTRCGARKLTDIEKAAIDTDAAAHMAKVKQAPAQGASVASTPKHLTGGTIYVYFHVINQGTGIANGDIPKSMIEQQIIVLNQAYHSTGWYFVLGAIDRTTNADWYKLAYKSTAETQMKTALRRGTAAALNIYTCEPTYGITGWSTYPIDYWTTSTVMDGVVLRHSTLPGGTSAPFNLGDTAVHEIGHWMGLFHTFEDGCGKNDTSSGDRIADTPSEKNSSNGCPVGRDSCGNQPGLDPIRNYMDFTDDSCMDSFTSGQDARMDLQFSTYRYNK